MYTLTRQEAADKLGISTRSVDRYIKSGKLRSKKEGKIIYIHATDVANITGDQTDSANPKVIITEKTSQKTSGNNSSYSSEKKENSTSTDVMDAQSRATLEKIYIDLRSELKTKDQTIQDLSLKLGQAQEIAKNSVSLVEFKKSQFLLEESKGHLSGELSKIKSEKQELAQKLKYEKSTNIILIIFCVLLVLGLGFVWFLNV